MCLANMKYYRIICFINTVNSKEENKRISSYLSGYEILMRSLKFYILYGNKFTQFLESVQTLKCKFRNVQCKNAIYYCDYGTIDRINHLL